MLLSRREIGIDQQQLARKVGVSYPYISKIERGHVSNVTLEVVEKLAEALGVSIAHLLGLTDAPLGNADDGAPVEASADRLVFEVRDAEMRRAIIELVAVLRDWNLTSV